MPDDNDKLNQALKEGLKKLDVLAEQMTAAGEKLKGAIETIDKVNSSFPETKAFLEARGLTSVSQLDAKGRQELTEHLEKRLTEIVFAGKPVS